MKIKILLLTDVLKSINGGAERQIYELAKRIDKNRFELYIRILHHIDIPAELKETGVNVQGLGIRRSYGINGILEGFKFSRFLKAEGVDILVSYHFASDIWGTIFGKLAKVPVIISNRRDAGFWRKRRHTVAYKLINRWVDKIVVVSEAVKQMVLRDEIASENKVEVIYNGVEPDKFSINIDIVAKKKELGLPLDSKVVGYVGNFNPIKGHKVLIEVAKSVLNKYPNVYFLLVGDGHLRVSLENAIRNTHDAIRDHILFLGVRKDTPELLQVMDVCVLPSLSEGLSNTLLEYMAAGKPVIATAVGGNPEVIKDKINGILIPPGDPVVLNDNIVNLLENKELAQRLAIEAQKTVSDKFNLTRQIRAMESSLESSIRKNKEVRIMHLISSNGIFGAEKVLLNLASNMNYNGIKSCIGVVNNLHNSHLEVFKEAEERGIPAYVVESKGRFDFGAVRQLERAIIENKINLLHTHNYKANFLGILAARRASVPVIATNHLWTKSGWKLRFYEFIDAIMLKVFVKKIIAVSESVKRDMVLAGIPGSRIKVILNGLDTAEPQNIDREILRDSFGIDKGVKIIGVVSRLSPEKGHKFLFEAIQIIVQKHSGIKLLIIGDGPSKEGLIKEVEHLGISEKVVFAGYQPDMNRIYPIIDILIQPSLREGIPITLLEGMNQSKPIVATDVGGVSELIKDRFTGLLIQPASSAELYNAITALLDDNSLCEKMGQNARKFAQDNFSLEKMINSYRIVYEELAGSNK